MTDYGLAISLYYYPQTKPGRFSPVNGDTEQ
jgi:hypothetical protein